MNVGVYLRYFGSVVKRFICRGFVAVRTLVLSIIFSQSLSRCTKVYFLHCWQQIFVAATPSQYRPRRTLCQYRYAAATFHPHSVVNVNINTLILTYVNVLTYVC